MSRVHLAALALPALCLGLSSNAIAKLPDPVNCEVPDRILLVACGADDTVDPLGTFTVLVRNFNGNPVEYSSVVLSFRNCLDVRICADPHDSGALVYCPDRSIRKLTDLDGRATFRVVGCATNHGASPGSTAPSLEVYADGVFLKSVRVAALDQTGGGVDGTDMSMFLADYFSTKPFARSDYDGDGALTANDFSLWLAAFFAGGSARSGGPTCP